MTSGLRALLLLYGFLALLPAGLRSQEVHAFRHSGGGPAEFSLVSERDPTLELHGLFRFKPGDDPRWADPAFDDSGWALIRGDEPWDGQGYPQLSGVAWYRFTLVLPAGGDFYSLLLPRIYSSYQIFVDGRLLLTVGKMPPKPVAYQAPPRALALPDHLGGASEPLQVAIRVWQDSDWVIYRPGGLQGPIEVGKIANVTHTLRLIEDGTKWRFAVDFGLAVLDLLAFTTALALFFWSRAEREYLWFCLLVFGLAVEHLYEAFYSILTAPLHLVQTGANIGFCLYFLASLLFYRRLLGARWTTLLKVCVVCCFLWSANAEAWGRVPGFTLDWENVGELMFTAPVYAWILTLIFKRARQRRPDARILVVPVTLLLVSHFIFQLFFTFRTLGFVWARHLTVHMWVQSPAEFSVMEVAEAFFLLAMLAILLNRFARTRREQDRVAAELDAARSVQQVLFPASLPATPGLEIETAYLPALELGGDFFQVLPLDGGETLVVIGDVAGKGLPAALTVSLVVGTLRTLVEYTSSPSEILAGLNRRLYGRGTGFTTCLAVRFSADCRTLTFANAGHLPPYVNGHEHPVDADLPLGFLDDANFTEQTMALDPGQKVTMLTDGVPEAMQGRELFGFERTAALSGEPAALIAQTALRFGQTDDITVIVVRSS